MPFILRPYRYATSGALGSKAWSIDHTQVGSTNHTDFPVLVHETFTELKSIANGGQITTANQVVFYDSDHTTILKFERQSHNLVTGEIYYWVKRSTVSHTSDTTGFLDWDATLTDRADPTNVWDSHYLGVYHCNAGAPVDGSDATGNANNASYIGTPTNTTGQIGDGVHFGTSGLGDALSASGISIPSAHDIHVSFWNKVASGKTGGFRVANSDSPNRTNCHAPFSDNVFYWDYGDITTNGRISTSYASFLSAWAYCSVVANGSNTLKEIRFNGSVATTSGTSSAPTSTRTGLFIGAQNAGIFSDGDMDEFRISDALRSVDYDLASYNNQKSGSTFNTFV